MHKPKKIFEQKEFVELKLPDSNFYHPSDVKKKHDLVSILQNQFIDKIKPLGLVRFDKLEEFRYLCESYFDYLNQIEEELNDLNYLEDEDERYL